MLLLPVAGARAAAALVQEPRYRSRVVREPRAVLRRVRHASLDDDVEVRVWDSSAEIRYLVLPLAPESVDGRPEDELATLVTRDHMIGVVR